MGKKKKGRSTQELMGIQNFTRYGLATNRGELLFFLVSPTNISVLSHTNIKIKIRHLMMVLSAIPDIEITCTDSCECFDDNQAYALELKKAGIIRNVGFSSHTPSVARKMLDAGSFDVMFFGVNAGYDYEASGGGLVLSPERTALYQECARRGVAITVMKVYNNGQLLDGRLSPFGRAMTTEQCLQYALDRPAVVSCLAGAVTAEEMERTLQFYDAPAQQRDYSFIGSLQSKEMVGSCTYCNHCQPCPAGIDVGAVNKYFDLAKVGDQLAAEHYKALSKNASDCTGCGVCVNRCPFHVDAKSRMEEIAQFFSDET